MGYMAPELSYREYVELRDGKEVFVAKEENIRNILVVPCDVILPKTWKGKAHYRMQMDMDIMGVQIPKGYVSDAASVPRVFWAMYPPVGRYLLAAFAHDWKLDQDHGWSESNRKFDEIMEAIGVENRRHFVILNSVRLNGWVRSKFMGETP